MRTSVIIDDRLLAQAQRLTGITTTRAVLEEDSSCSFVSSNKRKSKDGVENYDGIVTLKLCERTPVNDHC